MTRGRAVLAGLVPLAVLLVAWQALGAPDSPYLPSPSSWWNALRDLHAADELLPALGATIETFALALAAALVLGAALGLLLGASARVQRALGPLTEFWRTMPPPAIVPAAGLILGIGRSMAVVVVVLAAVWPITLNTVASVRGLHPLLLESARTLQLPVRAQVTKVLAPALVPGVLLGVRVAAPACVIVTLLVEMLTGTDGIGNLLLRAERNFASPQVFGLLVVVGAFGIAVNALVTVVEQRVLRRWPPRVGTS